MPCTVFIDESGDTGISAIRSPGKPGSSEYFTMGAVVLQPATAIHARTHLATLQKAFRKTKLWRHATDLNHSQKLHFCKTSVRLNARFFGVISNKATLNKYSEQIDWEPEKFYNKCAKYLLERVGHYLASVAPNLVEPQIIFEERNHDYDKLIRYIETVKQNPIYAQSKALKAINPFGITKKSKSEEPLLRYADLVSHALYCCVNKTPDNYEITEPRYLQELSGRFAADERGRVMGSGIKPIHTIQDLCLDDSVLKVLSDLRAAPPRPAAKRA